MNLIPSIPSNTSNTRIIVIKTSPTLPDIVPYVIVFIVYLIMVQLVLSLWKKLHDKSYNIFVLTSILLTLPSICIVTGKHLAVVLFALYLSFIIHLVVKSINFSLKRNQHNRNAPKIIFKFFKIIFLTTSHLTVLSQIFLILSFFIFPNYILDSLFMSCYFVYYAVLSREIVRNLCYIMASSTGFYSKDGIPGRGVSSEECMICTLPFREKDTPRAIEEKIVTLKCGHSYHEDCIKGWCLIGQNNSCYYCKDLVDNNSFNQEYWIKSEVMIAPMMRTMKSAISFSVIIFFVFLLKFK